MAYSFSPFSSFFFTKFVKIQLCSLYIILLKNRNQMAAVTLFCPSPNLWRQTENTYVQCILFSWVHCFSHKKQQH